MAECKCPRRYVDKTAFGVYHDKFDSATCFTGAITYHLATCTWGAGLTGGEYSSREEQQEGRDAVDEAYCYDDATYRDRARKGEP